MLKLKLPKNLTKQLKKLKNRKDKLTKKGKKALKKLQKSAKKRSLFNGGTPKPGSPNLGSAKLNKQFQLLQRNALSRHPSPQSEPKKERRRARTQRRNNSKK